uniref:hypothetical protein n=1 Tax=Aliarcobacter sp. TaxID=2321116 RepID=UPI0040481394
MRNINQIILEDFNNDENAYWKSRGIEKPLLHQDSQKNIKKEYLKFNKIPRYSYKRKYYHNQRAIKKI